MTMILFIGGGQDYEQGIIARYWSPKDWTRTFTLNTMVSYSQFVVASIFGSILYDSRRAESEDAWIFHGGTRRHSLHRGLLKSMINQSNWAFIMALKIMGWPHESQSSTAVAPSDQSWNFSRNKTEMHYRNTYGISFTLLVRNEGLAKHLVALAIDNHEARRLLKILSSYMGLRD